MFSDDGMTSLLSTARRTRYGFMSPSKPCKMTEPLSQSAISMPPPPLLLLLLPLLGRCRECNEYRVSTYLQVFIELMLDPLLVGLALRC